MPQRKISFFFRPSFPETHHTLQFSNEIEVSSMLPCEMDANSPKEFALNGSNLGFNSDSNEISSSLDCCEPKKNGTLLKPIRNLSKKRSYGQYHLDLGQSDFILYTCPVCGLMYARGVDEDEQVHWKFHQDYNKGIQFKGWHNERVVSGTPSNGDRILLILDSDSSAQQRVVQKAVQMAKKELEFVDDQIIHKFCKVYLFISTSRIIGWLVAEPIQTAHRIIPSSSSGRIKEKKDITDSKKKSAKTTLQFGGFTFHREPSKKGHLTSSSKPNEWDGGSILCEERAVPAKCGIMAIWVVPSSRRKKIATQLLDASRMSFCAGRVMDALELAFSPPTSAGLAFASSYMCSNSILIYRADDI